MKSLWIKLQGNWDNIKSLVTGSIESGVDVLVVEKENLLKVKELARGIKVATESDGADIKIVKVKNEDDLKLLQKDNCALIEIDSGKKEELVVVAAKIVDSVIIRGRDWKIIPLENLIAKLGSKKLLTFVDNLKDIKLAVGILERGVSGVVFSPQNPSEIKKAKEFLIDFSQEKIELAAAKITKIKLLGLGDRVCVDTSAILSLGEGMLIGSQSNGFFFVHSETLENPYVETRPFRVNAGAVHAYIKTPEDKTKYLSELKTGDEVLIISKTGKVRIENVGRVKIERRPMLLVEAESDGKIISTILQNAETIALIDKEGKPISVSKLKVGDEVLVSLESGGRHFGIKVEETLVER